MKTLNILINSLFTKGTNLRKFTNQWLLKTGFWDDNGLWDDTAIWID